MANAKRILKDLADVQGTPMAGCVVTLPEEGNMYIWEVVMDGPSKSTYENGKFKIEITFPKDYPFKPPILSFKTKIYHPNVSNDEKGTMCLGLLRSDVWKPSTKIKAVLELVERILAEPQPDDAVEASIADQYKTDRKAFEKTAKDWVNRYAK